MVKVKFEMMLRKDIAGWIDLGERIMFIHLIDEKIDELINYSNIEKIRVTIIKDKNKKSKVITQPASKSDSED